MWIQLNIGIAEEDTFRILKENVPQDWKMHLHCFTSSANFARDILDYFPNSFIGFTGKHIFLHFNNNNILLFIIQEPLHSGMQMRSEKW
jgi:TatD DNase family protein